MLKVEKFTSKSTVEGLQPAIIMLQEWWGINSQIREHAQRLADGTGALVILPDLYEGKSTLDAAEAHHLSSTLDFPKALNGLSDVVKDLKKDHKDRKIGVIGFCMGGALSLSIASKLSASSPLNACVAFYGTPSTVDLTGLPVLTPVLGLFGKDDTYKGFSDEPTAAKLAETWGVQVKTEVCVEKEAVAQVFIIPGKGHAFMNDDSETGHNKSADPVFQVKVWKEVFSFFEHHLKSL